MQYIYPFVVSFIFILFSELGDKTQILVLSFSTKNKASYILIGVALGTLLSHGLAIIFGSKLGILGNEHFIYYLKLFTYLSFILFGILGFVKLRKSSLSNSEIQSTEKSAKSHFIKLLSSMTQNCILVVAFSIAIGELGDKTFLASLGLGIEYPLLKLPLILGSVCGMVTSNSIAIFFGKWIGTKFSNNMIEILSNIIFLLFGFVGIVGILV